MCNTTQVSFIVVFIHLGIGYTMLANTSKAKLLTWVLIDKCVYNFSINIFRAFTIWGRASYAHKVTLRSNPTQYGQTSSPASKSHSSSRPLAMSVHSWHLVVRQPSKYHGRVCPLGMPCPSLPDWNLSSSCTQISSPQLVSGKGISSSSWAVWAGGRWGGCWGCWDRPIPTDTV